LAELPVRWLRDLDLEAPSSQGQPAFLSAASGLVATGRALYVVADDELHIGRFPLADSSPGTLQRVFAGELPADRRLRKKRKPDLEILMQLPPSVGWEQGALLALGSGSRRRRCLGALLPLDAQGRAGLPVEIDATPLFESLASELGELNLEGGWVQGSSLYLLQRGNKGASRNALVGIEFHALSEALQKDRVLPAESPQLIRNYDLGSCGGVPLGFTDGCALADGWLFSAVAEDTADPREDGQFSTAAVGMVDAGLRLQWLRTISPAYKIEGICVASAGSAPQLLLVADADDPMVPSSLLGATLD
jgi:hypothetical protein